MITDVDVKKLKEVFATKDDLNAVRVDVAILRSDVAGIKADMADVKTMVQKTLTTVTNFAGNIDTLQQENKMGAATLHRHGVQIQELATATGTTLSK